MKGIKHFGQRSAWLMHLVVILASWRCLAADPGSGNCDPGLQSAGGSEVGYAMRGDRCEGLYVQEVSGGALEIASLTDSFKPYKFANDKPLLLEWPTLGDAPVQVRASSLKRKLYYRMDTLRSQKPPGYTWPPDILSRLELGRDEVGLLAWTEHAVAAGKRKIHLPLRVTPRESVAPPQQAVESYKVVFVSSVELQEVYVTLCPLDSNGKPGKPIRKSSKLDYGFYPAERPIAFRISFSELSGAPDGLYSLSVGAELKNGEPKIAPEICLFHPRGGSPWPEHIGGKQ
jgi:hypothetical protein